MRIKMIVTNSVCTCAYMCMAMDLKIYNELVSRINIKLWMNKEKSAKWTTSNEAYHDKSMYKIYFSNQVNPNNNPNMKKAKLSLHTDFLFGVPLFVSSSFVSTQKRESEVWHICSRLINRRYIRQQQKPNKYFFFSRFSSWLHGIFLELSFRAPVLLY